MYTRFVIKGVWTTWPLLENEKNLASNSKSAISLLKKIFLN